MLLFGFLLLSTALVASRRIPEHFRVGMCIQAGKVKSVDNWLDIEGLSCDYQDIGYQRSWGGILFLKEWNIESFQKYWYHLQNYNLYVLNLDGNKIVEITSEILNDLPVNITTVFMRHNMITHIRREVINNEYVVDLDLTNNSISAIENWAFINMPQLKCLHLTQNQLNDTKFAATLPPSLRDLRLDGNPITEITSWSFTTLGNLEFLMLASTKITTIQESALLGLEKLDFLNLSFNFIEYVDADSFNPSPLLKEVQCGNSNDRFDVQKEKLKDLNNILLSCKNREFIIRDHIL